MKGLKEKLEKCFNEANTFYKIVIIISYLMLTLYVMKYFLGIKYFAVIFFSIICWMASYIISKNILPIENNLHKKIISSLIACSVMLCWIFYRQNLFINNIIAAILLCYILLRIPRIPMKLTITICVSLVIFDIIAVYFTDTMLKVAISAINNNAPMVINIPSGIKQISTGIKQLSIGLGDIFFPLLLIREEFYLSRIHNFPKIKKIPIFPMLLIFGHIIGINLAMFSRFYFQSSQPALIYIIPVMLIVLCINRLFLYKTRLATV